jgi:hypothetical protein
MIDDPTLGKPGLPGELGTPDGIGGTGGQGGDGGRGAQGIQGPVGMPGKFTMLRWTWFPTMLLCILIACQYAVVSVPLRNSRDLKNIEKTLNDRAVKFDEINERLDAMEASRTERAKIMDKLQRDMEEHNRRNKP